MESYPAVAEKLLRRRVAVGSGYALNCDIGVALYL